MNEQLFIPTRIKVGFDKREDTYTKMLAYVIYYDAKGKLRKEGSWEGWRDKKIAPQEYDNIPTEGFVLNKQVGGGGGYHYDWGGRMEKVRVFDPRGFEFEITTDNLLFILQEATSTKGKGLEGNFVYAWSGKDLVLIPCDCEEYRKSQSYTTGLSGKVSTKDLIPGCIYSTKKQEELIYLGKFNFADHDYYGFSVTKGHVFARKITKVKHKRRSWEYEEELEPFVCISPSTLSAKITDTPVDNYAELMENFNKSAFCPSLKNIRIGKAKLASDRTSYYYDELNVGNVFQKVSDKVFTAFNAVAIYKDPSNKPNDYWNRGSKNLSSYRLTPVATVTFEDDNGITIASTSGGSKTYKESEIDQLDLKTITVKSGKKETAELKIKTK